MKHGIPHYSFLLITDKLVKMVKQDLVEQGCPPSKVERLSDKALKDKLSVKLYRSILNLKTRMTRQLVPKLKNERR